MIEVTLQLPDELNGMVQRFEAVSQAVQDQLARQAQGGDIDYGAFEKIASQLGQDIERGMHEVALQNLDVNCEAIRVWGSAYRRVGRYAADYKSMAGSLRIERSIYRKVGERNGPTVDPVSLRAGVVEDGWLPRTAQAMGYLLASGTSREAENISAELMRLPYSRSSFERVGHAVGKLYTDASPRIEGAMIEAYTVPAEACSISVSIDRVSLPMEEAVQSVTTLPPLTAASLDPALVRVIDEFSAQRAHHGKAVASSNNAPPPAVVGKAEPQPEAAPVPSRDRALGGAAAPDAPPPRRFELDPRTEATIAQQVEDAHQHSAKVERNFRMAYCATVTLHDAKGDALHTIRYGRMPKGDVRGLMRALARDVQALRAKNSALRLVYLADGAKELWNLYALYLPAAVVGVGAIQLVDFWHATEYLGAAAKLLEWHKKALPGQFERWKQALLEKPRAIHAILQELRKSGLQNKADVNGNRVVGDAIRYIETRLPKMRYAAARRLGLPIGSGQVEATCKSLVGLRMKRPGARWKPTSGKEVLQLRTLVLSDRWQPAMTRTLSRLRKSVKAMPSHPVAMAA